MAGSMSMYCITDFMISGEKSQKKWLFCDVLKSSQIHLKKDVFRATSLRLLVHTSKKMSIL